MSETVSWRDQARLWRALKAEALPAATTIGISASFTANALEPQLGAALHGDGAGYNSILIGEYNQLHQSCLDPLNHFGEPVAILLLLWRIEDMFWGRATDVIAGHADAHEQVVADAVELVSLAKAASGNSTVIFGLPPAIDDPSIDPMDQAAQRSLRSLHRRVCEAVEREIADAPDIEVFDLDLLVTNVGRDTARDIRRNLLYRQPFTDDFFAVLGAELARSIINRSRSFPKCIAVDCDNTLWGGVVGEDGLEGIVIGSDFPGSAFQTLQMQLKRLKEKGVLLAITSKNDHSAVQEVFDKHPGMILTPDDIAAWRVNWMPKSENIRSLAEELNFGTDAFVFIDDSHFEINEVGAALPQVTCLQVPEEPADIPRLIHDSGLFRGMKANEDDVLRTLRIQQEAQRKEATEALTPQEFLHSLELAVTVRPLSAETLERTTQLINKTNQFNLTTVRRDATAVNTLADSATAHVVTCEVSDRFGDYGIVGVAIVTDAQSDEAAIDSFLLSCRVLGRGVEFAFLAAVSNLAAAGGASKLIGRFTATPKNGQVADFYTRAGFTDRGDGSFIVELEADAPAAPDHIRVDATSIA